MHSFFKAEWKTMVSVLLFGGAIFSWFYYQETLAEKAKAAPYEYTCLFAGKGLMNDRLGMTYDELAPKLSGFAQSEDPAIGTTRFESPDHIFAYTFRQADSTSPKRLSSIEYYPDMNHLDEHCAADFEQYKKSESQTAEPISYQNRQNIIYKGLVVIRENIPKKDDENIDSNASDNSVKTHDIGWIILPI